MAFVISIEGCHSVGKSSLINRMKAICPHYFYSSGDGEYLRTKEEKSGLQMKIEHEFYEIQSYYIEYEVQRFSRFLQDKIVISDRCPEMKEFYTFHYPKIHKYNWDVEGQFGKQLLRLRACRSNRILYLDASERTIRDRQTRDSKPRPTFEGWLRDWQPYTGAFFKSLPQTKVLNTEEMTIDDVLNWTISWIDGGCWL